MINENEPLLFVNTVCKVNKDNGQKIYDSRKANKNVSTITEKIIVEKENEEKTGSKQISKEDLIKLQNMVKLYNNNKTVICRIKTIDKECECIPIKIDGDKVYYKLQDSNTSDVLLKDIIKVEIAHI